MNLEVKEAVRRKTRNVTIKGNEIKRARRSICVVEENNMEYDLTSGCDSHFGLFPAPNLIQNTHTQMI
jgi:hypothetical protein